MKVVLALAAMAASVRALADVKPGSYSLSSGTPNGAKEDKNLKALFPDCYKDIIVAVDANKQVSYTFPNVAGECNKLPTDSTRWAVAFSSVVGSLGAIDDNSAKLSFVFESVSADVVYSKPAEPVPEKTTTTVATTTKAAEQTSKVDEPKPTTESKPDPKPEDPAAATTNGATLPPPTNLFSSASSVVVGAAVALAAVFAL
ncbi:hypothetical protein BDR26DRAFT_857159 [Obelidium mucronatum]|nr:hypothetical protein BDR26DRAFT_857159 [Obelidium mucronatum]